MKKIIKLSLFLLIIITSTIFYRYFFLENEKSSLDIEIPNEQVVENPESNIIKNLKYEVKLADQNKYIITSELSEITEKNGPEIVIMKIATAVFLDKKNIPLKVTSDIAEYNNETHNTNFSQNVSNGP